MYILEIKDLNKKFNKFSLKDINLKVEKGTIMGIVGENGAGKTTLIKSILETIKIDSGEVLVFGEKLKDNKDLKEDIGVVIEDGSLPTSIVLNNINKIMKNIYKNWEEKTFKDYLKKFKLDESKKISDLSKGMKMKLSIAIALSHNSKLLILDEPTSGLDPIAREEILEELMEFIQDENKSIIFSTHITSDLDKIADYITFIHNGEILLTESKEVLINNYGLVKYGLDDKNEIKKEDILGYKENKFGNEVLVSNIDRYSHLLVDRVNIEEIMIYIIGGKK